MWFAPRQNGRFDANAELRGSKAASRLYHYAPLNGSLVESGFSLEFPADADGSCDGCCRRLGDVGVCVCVCVSGRERSEDGNTHRCAGAGQFGRRKVGHAHAHARSARLISGTWSRTEFRDVSSDGIAVHHS